MAAAAGGAGSAGPHTCDICGRGYKRRDTLLLHLRKHQGLTTCARCGKVLPTRSDLRRHLLREHQLSREQILTEAPPIGALSSLDATVLSLQEGTDSAGLGGFESTAKNGEAVGAGGRGFVDSGGVLVDRSDVVDGGGQDGDAVDAGGLETGAVDRRSVEEPAVDAREQELPVIPVEEME